ncbi:hypothetical protein L5515_010341 [Caenorhabditis briggsae]|uniref:Uncharacterized protein n=1 Tax=Caenorhabditis briggsae TaxID=6238 RepID=A0AAE9ERL0_CAEBR|nr:hypothetical protein L5515_010341 [Caenorhabditis briggsae]
MPNLWRTEETSGQNPSNDPSSPEPPDPESSASMNFDNNETPGTFNPTEIKTSGKPSIPKNTKEWRENQKKVLEHFEKEQFVGTTRAYQLANDFGKTPDTIYGYFFHKRKEVIKRYLAGKISFENLPSQIKILEGEYQKNSRLQSQQQVNALCIAAGVGRDAIFRYFRSREKMDKDIKAAKSVKAPSNYRYAPRLVPATERAATQSLSHEFRQDTEPEIEDLAPPVPVTEVVHSQQSHVSQKPEDLVDAPTRDDQALSTLSNVVIDEYLASKTSFESNFGTNKKKILKLFYKNRKAVMDAHLAGVILFENLPCEIKILETEFQKCSNLTTHVQIERFAESGLEENVIFEYFNMRRKMNAKTEKSGDTSEGPSEAVDSPKLESPTQPAPSTRPNVFIVAHEDPDPPVPSTETVQSPLLPNGPDNQQELEDPVPNTEMVHYQQTQGAQNQEGLVEDEQYEIQEDETIPSHGALPDWDFVFAHMRQKPEDQAPISLHVQPTRFLNPIRESQNQNEEGVDEKVIRFFEYFHTRRKMTQKMRRQIGQGPWPESAIESEATQPLLHELHQDIKQEIGDLAPPVPVAEVVHSHQSHGAQNLETLIDDDRYETEEEKTIPSHGALLHLDLPSPHNLQKLLKQTQETLAVCHANVAEKQSGKIDYTTSPMSEAPTISVPALNYQAVRSQQDARSQARLLADLSRQMTAIQQTLGAYMAATPRTHVPNKGKRSPSLEVVTNEPSVSPPVAKRANHQEAVSFDGVEVQKAPEALRGVNEIVAPTPERQAQLRQERLNLYNGEFEDTYLPFNHSINYKSWTRQQFEEFAVQFLPLEVVTALVKMKVDGSKMEKIRCNNKLLMGRLHNDSSSANESLVPKSSDSAPEAEVALETESLVLIPSSDSINLKNKQKSKNTLFHWEQRRDELIQFLKKLKNYYWNISKRNNLWGVNEQSS